MSPKQERLPIVIKLREYFAVMCAVGPAPEAIHVWPEQVDLLLKHLLVEPQDWNVPLDQQDCMLRIDGLPAVRIVRHIEIDEREVV